MIKQHEKNPMRKHEKTPCLPSSLGATMIHPPKHTHTRSHAPGINAITRAQFFTRLTGGGSEIVCSVCILTDSLK